MWLDGLQKVQNCVSFALRRSNLNLDSKKKRAPKLCFDRCQKVQISFGYSKLVRDKVFFDRRRSKLDLDNYQKVQKCCLMARKRSKIRFHLDFVGPI